LQKIDSEKYFLLLSIQHNNNNRNNYSKQLFKQKLFTNMPIRINATTTRTTNNSSSKTTRPRRFNRNSFKGGRRNFNRGRRPVTSTFEQRNSIGAYISNAKSVPKQCRKIVDNDGWTTLVSKKNITMRTPARHRQMIKRSQNKFDVLSQPEKKRTIVAMPTVVKYKAPTGAWGKPLAAAVKEEAEFDHAEDLIEEEDETDQMVLLDTLKVNTDFMSQNWGDMAMEEDEAEEAEVFYDLNGRPYTDNSAW
tara:strand:+ start:552 stop:1298 length:747 start_codon:yes stop_codon:yes gene_type:complete